MGEIVVDIQLESLADRAAAKAGLLRDADVRRATIAAVADTGAMMLALPEDVVSQLGLEQLDSITATYADGRQAELQVAGSLIVQIGDRWMAAECVVVPQGADALIGQLVMERLDLIPDPAKQTLNPRPESPDRPLIRL